MELPPRGALRTIGTLDQRVSDRALAARCGPLDLLFVPFSLGGAAGLPWLVVATALRRYWPSGQRLGLPVAATATIGGWATAKALKAVWYRDRPCHTDTSRPLVRCPESSSFPSDRAASAFAGATAITTAIPELSVPLYTLAALTAIARVYVRAHYPTDAAAGATIGLALARLVNKLAT